MKKEIESYLRSININSETLLSKINKTLEAAQRIHAGEILDIFVSDRTSGEGPRSYEHMYLFTNEYIVEAADFSTDPSVNVELTVLKDRVKYVLFKFSENYGKSALDTHLILRCYTDTAHFVFLAGKEDNCNKLLDIYDKYIKPNFSKIPIAGTLLES